MAPRNRATTFLPRYRAGTSTDSANGVMRLHYLPIALASPDESVDFERICHTIYNRVRQPHTRIGMKSGAIFHPHGKNKP